MGGPHWEVVGGIGKGGILVRSGPELSSNALDNRLETGALVREQRREGDRLLYTLLTGAGPPEGWVSVKVEGKALLALAPLDGTQDLDVEVMTLGQGVVANLRLCRSTTSAEVHDKLAILLGEPPSAQQHLVVGTQIFEGTVCLGDIVEGSGPVKMTLVQTSPMGLAALVGGRDGELQLLDLESGHVVREFEAHRGQVKCVALHVVSQRGVTGSKDGSLRLWDIRQVQPLLELRAHQDGVNCVAVDWPSMRALTGGEDWMLRLWDLEYAEALIEMTGHQAGVTSVVWDPECECALSGAKDCTLRVWTVDTGECYRELRGHLAPVHCVAANFPRGVAISGSIAIVRIWHNIISPNSHEYYRDWEGHNGWVLQVAGGWSREVVLSLDHEGSLRLLNLSNNGTLEFRNANRSSRVTCVAPLWYSKHFLVGNDDGTLHMWNEFGEVEQEMLCDSSGVACVAIDGAAVPAGAGAEEPPQSAEAAGEESEPALPQSVAEVVLSLPVNATTRNIFAVTFQGASHGEGRARPTVGMLRKQLEENHQVPYLYRLKFRRRGRDAPLADNEKAPVPPMELHVGGPETVVQALNRAMQALSTKPPPNAVQ